MIILAADLHLTDKPQDNYRFKIFDKLSEWCEEYEVEDVILLGDLTDFKDGHSAKLVNRIADGIDKITAFAVVTIIMGNHDYVDPEIPFFEFLGKIPNVVFLKETDAYLIDGSVCWFIPHQREFNIKDIKSRIAAPFSKPDYIFIHQCVDGAIAESGKKLTGINTKPLSALKPKGGIWAGDIHKPQHVGPVQYVGAPYNIRFGDNFEGRCILLDTHNHEYEELKFHTPLKHSITIRDAEELYNHLFVEGDHVKITIELTNEEITDAPEQKAKVLEFCKQMDLIVFGVDIAINKSKKRVRLKRKDQASKNPSDVLSGFCKYEKVPSEYEKVGQKIVEEAK